MALRKGVLSYAIMGVGTKTAPTSSHTFKEDFPLLHKGALRPAMSNKLKGHSKVLPGQFVPKKKLDTYFMYLQKRNKVAFINLD